MVRFGEIKEHFFGFSNSITRR